MREDTWPLPNYRPRLKHVEWEQISSLVRAISEEARSRTAYSTQDVMAAVSRHLDWAYLMVDDVRQYERLFARPMIAASVLALPSATKSTQSKHRSILLRTAEAIGVLEPVPPMPALGVSTAARPYTAHEQAELRVWASAQGKGVYRRSLRVLLALGFGAGLLTNDLARVRAGDIAAGGRVVRIMGEKPRLVPVSRDVWAEWLEEAAVSAHDADELLFQPAWKRHVNIVKRVVEHAQGDKRPLPTRMRATWVIQRLTEGAPIPEFLAAAGVSSLDAFRRLQPYFPAPQEVDFESSWGYA